MAAQHRAKNLFGPQATACRHIRIYSRAYKPARLLRGGTAGEAVQAFGTGDGEILHHFGPLRLAGQRPHVDFFGRGVAHAQFFNGDGQALQQRIGDAVVHQQPRSGRTHLPGVPAKTGDDPFNRLVEVAIVEHHDCRLATQLQCYRCQVGCGGTHDQTPDPGGSGEDDVVEWQRREKARIFKLTTDQGHLRVVEHLCQQTLEYLVGVRVELGHLEHHPVACGERTDQTRNGDVNREIPCRYDPHHAFCLILHPQLIAFEQQLCGASAWLHPAPQMLEGVIDVQDATHQVKELGVDGGAMAKIGAHRRDNGVLVTP
ncbi:hypothetical protein D9M73_147330 [compost metagenome]